MPLLERAHRDILDASGGKPPRVLDPFAGGGAIPLEALRLGCETCASDRHHLCQPPADCLILLQFARLCKPPRCARSTRRRPW